MNLGGSHAESTENKSCFPAITREKERTLPGGSLQPQDTAQCEAPSGYLEGAGKVVGFGDSAELVQCP